MRDKIQQIREKALAEIAEKYGVKYLFSDFKKLTIELAENVLPTFSTINLTTRLNKSILDIWCLFVISLTTTELYISSTIEYAAFSSKLALATNGNPPKRI